MTLTRAKLASLGWINEQKRWEPNHVTTQQCARCPGIILTTQENTLRHVKHESHCWNSICGLDIRGTSNMYPASRARKNVTLYSSTRRFSPPKTSQWYRMKPWHQTSPGKHVYIKCQGTPRSRWWDISIRMALVHQQTDVVSQEAAPAARMKMPHIQLVQLCMAVALFPLLWVCVCWHLPDKISSSKPTQTC